MFNGDWVELRLLWLSEGQRPCSAWKYLIIFKSYFSRTKFLKLLILMQIYLWVFFHLITKWKHAYFLEIHQKQYLWFGCFGKIFSSCFCVWIHFFNTSALTKQANSATVYAFWKLLCWVVYSNTGPILVSFFQVPFTSTALKSRFFEHHLWYSIFLIQQKHILPYLLHFENGSPLKVWKVLLTLTFWI